MVKKKRGQSAAFMRSINPNLHRRKSKNKRGSKTMVKHRRKSAKRRSGRSAGQKQNLMKSLVYALGYGLVRNPIANFTTPMVSKVISTPYNDHVGNGAAAFAAYKFGKGMIREVGKVALIAEVASATTGFSFGSRAASSNNGYVFA